jgi:hypothetical protein
MDKPNKNRSIFIAITVFFIALFVYISYDMSSRTTAPWNKPKQLNRALPGATPDADSLLLDSLLEEMK